jgi:hypothetical protein
MKGVSRATNHPRMVRNMPSTDQLHEPIRTASSGYHNADASVWCTLYNEIKKVKLSL